MIDIQPLIDIIALSLQSAFVRNERNGVSLLIVASPETAKTTSIFKFHNLDFVAYYDEITAKKLLDEFLPLVKANQKRTLLIPDLINCIEKQRSTRNQFLALIKSGIDDTGVVAISTYAKQLYFINTEGVRFNMITAITSSNFKQIYKYLKNTGLLSRFIPFSYSYPINKVKKILSYIEGFDVASNVTIPQINKKDTIVTANPELFREFEIVSTKLGQLYGSYGIRAQINLQRLAKANALLNNRTDVTTEDITKVLELSRFMNFEFNTM